MNIKAYIREQLEHCSQVRIQASGLVLYRSGNGAWCQAGHLSDWIRAALEQRFK